MSADKKKKSVKIICENQRRIRVISVLIFIRIGEPLLVSPVPKIDLVDRETGRPVDREGERRGPVSLVYRSPGLPVYGAT